MVELPSVIIWCFFQQLGAQLQEKYVKLLLIVHMCVELWTCMQVCFPLGKKKDIYFSSNYLPSLCVNFPLKLCSQMVFIGMTAEDPHTGLSVSAAQLLPESYPLVFCIQTHR